MNAAAIVFAAAVSLPSRRDRYESVGWRSTSRQPPSAEVQKRRAANKAAKKSRRINRKRARP